MCCGSTADKSKKSASGPHQQRLLSFLSLLAFRVTKGCFVFENDTGGGI